VPKRNRLLIRSESPWPFCGGIFDWDNANIRLQELNAKAEDPDLWNDPDHARTVMRERQQLEDSINAYNEIESGLNDSLELIALGEEEGDKDVVADAEKTLNELARLSSKREVEALLSGEADANDAFLEVHAGAGGTESQDWAQMLSRMYLRWAESQNLK